MRSALDQLREPRPLGSERGPRRSDALHLFGQETPQHFVCDHVVVDGQDYFICACGHAWDVFTQPQRVGPPALGPVTCRIGALHASHAAARAELTRREVADWLLVSRDQLRTMAIVLPALERKR